MDREKSVAFVIKVLLLLASSLEIKACPYPCACTDFKVDCYGKGLKEIPDNFPPDVTSIDLQYNDIESIGDQFHNLTSVQEVMLRFNRISHIADGAFSNSPSLKHINLGSNLLANLSSNAFQNMSQMRILDLTDNRLTSVDGSFEGLPGLTKLVLTRNLVEELTKNSLKPLINLIYFMADENQISTIHPAAFHSLTELSFVSLIKNPLRNMDNVLVKNDMLSYLNLDDCQLSNIPKGLPWATRNLELQRNNITSIPKETFMSTQYLGIIKLDDNRITHVETDAFTPIAHLQELWLNGNQLTALPYPIPSTVHTLSLDNNDIATVSHDNFLHDSQLKVLSLKGNNISRIDPFTFSRLAYLKKLHLGENSITELQDKSFFGMRNLTLLEVGDNPITHIDVRFAAGLHNLDTLDMSYVQDSEPFMKGNFFRDIPFLKALLLRASPSLASNILTSNQTLKSFYHLKELDVRDNDLHSIDIDLPRFFPSLQRLLLAGNAWLCDPRLLWLHDWMKTSRDIFEDVDNVVCDTPPHLAGSVIADLPYHAFFYTTTLPTTSTTESESAESGDADYTAETDSGEGGEVTTIVFTNLTTQGNDSSTVSLDVTTTITSRSTSTDNSINDTGENSSRIKGPVTTSSAEPTTAATFTQEATGTEKAVTSTLPPRTSGRQTESTQTTSPTPTSTVPHTPVPTVTSTTTTNNNHRHPRSTDIPRHGGSQTSPDDHSASLTRNIIIATCVGVIALIIIVVVALVLIPRHKGKIRLVFYRALAQKNQTGDTEFVLNDQDEPDSSHNGNPTTQLSESEEGSTPSVEIASDDGLCTRLV